MKMKSKPNTAQFKGLKDPDAFLEGAEADRTEKPLSASAVVTTAIPLEVEEEPRRRRGRVQKIFNFSEDLADRLRDAAMSRSRETGTRVTEKDIVVEALEAHLKI
ncbi:plasmid segregation centromere-binding protein ParG [Nitrosospira sp. Nsp11]|uniref:hypothetical protein n=1 Tax=Nitrosospira sp. Nsp11 TaxID=1855338 RepID=UPI00091A4C6E|nr:hypothetical protein [Nitrosospira sp. Nsp11]SHM13801.1 plasmid segregation centromere-binding protein ParG [Nitrosospira sp. Nsp11]